MPDPTESTAEAQPLKGEEGAQDSPGGKKDGCWSRLGLSRLSNWRTAGFFLSLFLCLTVVFAFSFIIPCPVRPEYLRTWNHSFPQAGEGVERRCLLERSVCLRQGAGVHILPVCEHVFSRLVLQPLSLSARVCLMAV